MYLIVHVHVCKYNHPCCPTDQIFASIKPYIVHPQFSLHFFLHSLPVFVSLLELINLHVCSGSSDKASQQLGI